MVELNSDKKSIFILSVKFTIIFACLALTCWQIVLCFKKFASSPLSTNIDIQDVAKSNLPDITFCVDDIYNQTLLQECGIQQYAFQWSSDICPDAGKLYDKVHYPSEYFLKSALGTSWSPSKFEIFNRNNLKRSRVDCFTIPIYDVFDTVRLAFNTNVSIYVHQKGNFKKHEDKPIQFNDKHSDIEINLDYEVIQNAENQDCIDDVSYIKEDCIWNQLYQESMAAFGCITPYGPTNHSICLESETIVKTQSLYFAYFFTNNHTCKDPCKMTLMHYNVLKQEVDDGTIKEIKINFPKHIKVFTTFSTNSIISLIAEIGGYVGLFLGFSIMDILTSWTYLFNRHVGWPSG